jgi:group II intron reverse transcriptase/maturase
MSTILKQAASAKVLNMAWKKLCNDKAPWSPGLSRDDMQKDHIYHILRLGEDLNSGKYRPHPVRFFPVNKGDGKQRIISAHTLRDKMAQRAILIVLEPIFEKYFHHDSYAYRPGRSIQMALSRVNEYVNCGLNWIIDADIQNYFDNIPHKQLLKAFKKINNDRKVLRLIYQWLDVGTARRGFLSQSKGIPQGAVLSPLLCNIYLTKFDNDMARKNLPFVRFADDFLVFTQSKNEAHTAYAYVEKCLNRLSLSLNPEKSRVTACGPHIKFLGQQLANAYHSKNRRKHGFSYNKYARYYQSR